MSPMTLTKWSYQMVSVYREQVSYQYQRGAWGMYGLNKLVWKAWDTQNAWIRKAGGICSNDNMLLTSHGGIYPLLGSWILGIWSQDIKHYLPQHFWFRHVSWFLKDSLVYQTLQLVFQTQFKIVKSCLPMWKIINIRPITIRLLSGSYIKNNGIQ